MGKLLAVLVLLLLLPFAAAANFKVGDTVEVKNKPKSGDGLFVRDVVCGSNTIVKKYTGDLGYVVEGSKSCNGFTWWKVRWPDGNGGWSADGAKGKKWLVKKSIPKSTAFKKNDAVQVKSTGGTGLFVRSNPPELKLQTTVSDGSQGKILDGPIYAVPFGGSAFAWFWKVQFGSTVGWAGEVSLEKAGSPSPDQATRIPGLDVSHWQNDRGAINWNSVYSAGYRFAFVKASEGKGYIDPYFTQNMGDGKAAGVAMGAYHFARPTSNAAEAEAAHFLSVAVPYLATGYLRPVLDLEEGAGMGREALTTWALTWLTYVEQQTGVKPIIYVNSNYAQNYLDSRITAYELWVAQYNPQIQSPKTGVWNGVWAFWQYTSSGSVPGITGNVDLNWFNGNQKDLAERFIVNGAPLPTKSHDARFISQSVPATMEAGKAYTVSITMENTGTMTWTRDANFKLGSQSPENNGIWRDGRVLLDAGEAIAPGQSKIFTFAVTAPTTPGTYNFQWMMLQELVTWFGQPSLLLAITVTAPAVPQVDLGVNFLGSTTGKCEPLITSWGTLPTCHERMTESGGNPVAQRVVWQSTPAAFGSRSAIAWLGANGIHAATHQLKLNGNVLLLVPSGQSVDGRWESADGSVQLVFDQQGYFPGATDYNGPYLLVVPSALAPAGQVATLELGAQSEGGGYDWMAVFDGTGKTTDLSGAFAQVR